MKKVLFSSLCCNLAQAFFFFAAYKQKRIGFTTFAMNKPQKQLTMSENYNIFKVLKFERKETIHSAMIAAIASYDSNGKDLFFNMLKKKAKENVIGNAFDKKIEKLIKTIDFNSIKEGHWIRNEVQLWESVERNTGKVSVNRGRADIWIGTNRKIWNETDGKTETKQYRLIIENKINAGNQDHQLRRYYRYLKDKRREFAGLFFLCPIFNDHFKQQAIESAQKYKDKNGNDKESKVDGKGRPETEFAIITYKDDIIPWLADVKETSSGDFLKVVSDYHELVVSLVENWDK